MQWGQQPVFLQQLPCTYYRYCNPSLMAFQVLCSLYYIQQKAVMVDQSPFSLSRRLHDQLCSFFVECSFHTVTVSQFHVTVSLVDDLVVCVACYSPTDSMTTLLVAVWSSYMLHFCRAWLFCDHLHVACWTTSTQTSTESRDFTVGIYCLLLGSSIFPPTPPFPSLQAFLSIWQICN